MAATQLSRKDRVFKYLKSNRKFVPGFEIASPEVGGSEGLRRLRELRSEGVNIISRRNPTTGQFEYKLKR